MKNYCSPIVLFLLIILCSFSSYPQGFLHRLDKKIVNGAGSEVLLKGIGLGGWLLQEGYMLHTADFANAQWQIRAKILDLVGQARTDSFYEAYRNNYVRKIDIDSIKKWGFNSIRLPFHYNLFATNTNPPVFLNKGFEIVDSLLAWCEENHIYLILDMHAAPGGQSDQNISDYNPAYPSLWQSEQNKTLTVQIWRKIAEHYKDKEWIGGYDLINEPKWDLPPNNQPLRDLYIRLTDTIRAVDTSHIIFIEGNWYATDFNGLTPAWDENMAYSFHKYWNNNDQASIQGYLNIRSTTNRPLWLGETGENSNSWFVNCIELMKNTNIGWAWWPHKKIDAIAGPLSAPLLSGYQTLLNYWKGQAPRPTADFAYQALMNQAYALAIENCTYHLDVIDAMFRQPFNTTTEKFAANEIPGTIFATDYDLGKVQYAYNDADYQNTGGTDYNRGYSYRNDGVDIEKSTAFLSNGYNVGYIESSEWLKYTVDVAQSGIYDININVASANSGGQMFLNIDYTNITPLLTVPATGGWQNWQYITVRGVYISSGRHTLQAKFIAGGFNFSFMEFVLITADAKEQGIAPGSFKLNQNYPNPFNPETTITYSVPFESFVTIKLFDILGDEISTLVDGYKNSGNYIIDLNAKNLPSGTYIVSMSAGNFTENKKILLLK